jgi:hypothetical protein
MKKQIWQDIRDDMKVEMQEEIFVKLSGMEMCYAWMTIQFL